jgi:Family of unknown function (DUF5675)
MATVQRGPSLDVGCFSTAILDVQDGLQHTFRWLELPWRNNTPGKSCIPIGVFTAHVVQSPHFGYPVYRLDFVPGRTLVEIHKANWAGDVDKGLYSDLEGCMAPGTGVGDLVPPGRTDPQRALLDSGDAFKRFMDLCKGQPLTLRVIAFGAVGM